MKVTKVTLKLALCGAVFAANHVWAQSCVWTVHDTELGAQVEWTWTQRGATNEYDAVKRNAGTGKVERFRFKLYEIRADRSVVFGRDDFVGRHRGTISADGRTAKGFQDWTGAPWTAELSAGCNTGGGSAANAAPPSAPPPPPPPPPSGRGNANIDVRATFPEIKPYTSDPSKPVTRQFSFPGPGRFRVRVVYGPWYRNTNNMIKWRSTVPIDGRDFGAWSEFLPGGIGISKKTDPERFVDGGNLVIDEELYVRQAQPGMEVAIFPAIVRFGDGSFQQLRASASVTIEWLGNVK